MVVSKGWIFAVQMLGGNVVNEFVKTGSVAISHAEGERSYFLYAETSRRVLDLFVKAVKLIFCDRFETNGLTGC